MTNETLCNYFLAVIKKTGKYQRAYEDWITRDEALKTWAHLKDFWRAEHLKLRRSNPTAFQFQFGGSVTEQEGDNNGNVSEIMENCANKLMNGQQEAATQQQQFQQMMVAQMNALQQQLQMQQGATAAMMQQSAAAMTANQRPPFQNNNNNRSNNNNRGGGGGGNWKQQAWTNMQMQPPMQNNNFYPAYNNNNNNKGAQKSQQNPFCWYENQNYCHTHGHHVENDHTSQTCTMPGPNHNPNATKFNTMGGSNKGVHKTIMPSQCGRTPTLTG